MTCLRELGCGGGKHSLACEDHPHWHVGPCRFCGSQDIDFVRRSRSAQYRCRKCQSRGPLKNDYTTAAIAWGQNPLDGIEPELRDIVAPLGDLLLAVVGSGADGLDLYRADDLMVQVSVALDQRRNETSD